MQRWLWCLQRPRGVCQPCVLRRAGGQVERMVRALPLEIRGCRIEAILAVWEAISDMCNIERVLYALTMPERSELIQRVGYLQLYVGSGDCVAALGHSRSLHGCLMTSGGIPCAPMGSTRWTCPYMSTVPSQSS